MTSIPQPDRGGFVFGDADENAPNKIIDLTKVTTYMVAYNDGSSKKQVRLAFRVPGSKSTFLLQEKIQGQHVATVGTSWFQKEFLSKLREKGFEASEDEGVEGADQV